MESKKPPTLLTDVLNYDLPKTLIEKVRLERQLYSVTDETLQPLLQSIENFLKDPSRQHIFPPILKWWSLVRYKSGDILKKITDFAHSIAPDLNFDCNYSISSSILDTFPFLNDSYHEHNYLKCYPSIYKIKHSTKENEFYNIFYNDDITSLTDYDLNDDSLIDIKGASFIHIAAISGAIKCFKYILLNCHHNIDPQISKYAIAGGNIDIVHILEDLNISFNGCLKPSIFFNHYDLTDWLLTNYSVDNIPLSYCLITNNDNAFLYFLLNSWDPNQISLLYSKRIKNETGAPPEMLEYSALYVACKHDGIDEDIIRILLDYGASPNIGCFLPLYEIVANKHPIPSRDKFIKEFINKGANINSFHWEFSSEFYDYTVSTPICAAVKNNDISLVKTLIDAGADVNKFEYDSENECTSTIVLALQKNNWEMLNFLYSNGAKLKLDYNEVKSNSIFENHYFFSDTFHTVNCDLMYYCLRYTFVYNIYVDDKDLIKLCVNTYSEDDFMDMIGFIVFEICHHKFCWTEVFLNKITKRENLEKILLEIFNHANNKISNIEMLTLVLQKLPNIKKEDYILEYIKHNYIQKPEIIQLLFDYGAETNFAECLKHLKCNHFNIIKLFIGHGMNSNEALCEVCKWSKSNNGNIEIETKMEIIQYLVGNGADINRGNTLYYECKNKPLNYDIIKFFIEHGADINSKQNDYSALDQLCQNESLTIDFIKLLNKHGVDCRTIFSKLGGGFNKEVVLFLIENGADINAINEKGETLLCRLFHSLSKDHSKKYLYELLKISEKWEKTEFLFNLGADINVGNPTTMCTFFKNISSAPYCAQEINDFIIYILEHHPDLRGTAAILKESIRKFMWRNIEYYVIVKFFFSHGLVDLNTIVEIVDNMLNDDDDSFALYDNGFKKITEFISFLIDGYDIDQEINGETPLYSLCKRNVQNNLEGIQYLISNGADINKVNSITKKSPSSFLQNYHKSSNNDK